MILCSDFVSWVLGIWLKSITRYSENPVFARVPAYNQRKNTVKILAGKPCSDYCFSHYGKTRNAALHLFSSAVNCFFEYINQRNLYTTLARGSHLKEMTPEGGLHFFDRKFIKHFRKLREVVRNIGMYVYACTIILTKK